MSTPTPESEMERSLYEDSFDLDSNDNSNTEILEIYISNTIFYVTVTGILRYFKFQDFQTLKYHIRSITSNEYFCIVFQGLQLTCVLSRAFLFMDTDDLNMVKGAFRQRFKMNTNFKQAKFFDYGTHEDMVFFPETFDVYMVYADVKYAELYRKIFFWSNTYNFEPSLGGLCNGRTNLQNLRNIIFEHL